MKRSKLFGFAAIVGAAFLVIGVYVLVGRLTFHYFAFPVYEFLLVGTICTWVGLWWPKIENLKLKKNPGMLKVAYLIGLLGIVLAFVAILIVYMFTSGMEPAF